MASSPLNGTAGCSCSSASSFSACESMEYDEGRVWAHTGQCQQGQILEQGQAGIQAGANSAEKQSKSAACLGKIIVWELAVILAHLLQPFVKVAARIINKFKCLSKERTIRDASTVHIYGCHSNELDKTWIKLKQLT